jgi:hypothetical protein
MKQVIVAEITHLHLHHHRAAPASCAPVAVAQLPEVRATGAVAGDTAGDAAGGALGSFRGWWLDTPSADVLVRLASSVGAAKPEYCLGVVFQD